MYGNAQDRCLASHSFVDRFRRKYPIRCQRDVNLTARVLDRGRPDDRERQVLRDRFVHLALTSGYTVPLSYVYEVERRRAERLECRRGEKALDIDSARELAKTPKGLAILRDRGIEPIEFGILATQDEGGRVDRRECKGGRGDGKGYSGEGDSGEDQSDEQGQLVPVGGGPDDGDDRAASDDHAATEERFALCGQ